MIAIDTPSFISYPGAGTVGPFTIPFPVFEVDNVEARIIDSLGAIDNLVISTDFTLSTIKPNTTISLTLVNALPLLSTLEIRFSKRANQPAKLRDLGRFAPEIFEKALDRLTMNILAVGQGITDSQTSTATVQGEVDALEARVDAIEMLDLVQDLSLNDHESRIDALEAASSISATVEVKSANFTAAFDYVYVITAAVSVQLPAPVANKSLTLKASAVTPVTILRNGSEKIDFVAADKTMPSQDQALTLVTDGTDWYII